MDWHLPLLVFLGSGLGGTARWLVGFAIKHPQLPVGTFLVNVAGCFLIGLLLVGGTQGQWLGPNSRIFLAAGLLGGFTTMSSFGFETLEIYEAGRTGTAAAYAGLTIAVCLVATGLGRATALAIWPRM